MKTGFFITALLLLASIAGVLGWSASASSAIPYPAAGLDTGVVTAGNGVHAGMGTTLVRALQPTFCDNVGEIPGGECQALLALYESTDGGHWADNSGWVMTYTPCSWYGVTCAGGHVSALSLPTNQLTGNIPSELGGVASLQYLYLNGNQLNGAIPPQLGSLTNLLDLSVQNNALSGEVPAELASLVNLSVLDVGYNALAASDPAAASFLDDRDPDWRQTQTVPPADLHVTAVTSRNPRTR